MAGLSAAIAPVQQPLYPKMTSHYPKVPPKTPNAAIEYARAIQEAPVTALVGVTGPKQPDKHHPTTRCRMRNQVGLTNRWRLPEYLGSDLLGSAQAIKATRSPLNKSLIRIMTAEGPRHSLNLDLSQPYKFRQSNDRAQPCRGPHLPEMPVGRSGSAGKENTTLTVARPPRIPPLNSFIPGTARAMTPKEVFQCLSKRSQISLSPDVLLHCMDVDWELHRAYLQKSTVLSEILKAADNPKHMQYYNMPEADALHKHIKKGALYSNDYHCTKHAEIGRTGNPKRGGKSVDRFQYSRFRVNNVTVIELEITDPLVTEHALAVALGHLYRDDVVVEADEAAGVLAAAHFLGFHPLAQGCVNVMLSSINYKTVCSYHNVATEFQEEKLTTACEGWLEVNLVPKLAFHIQLRQLSFEALHKVIKSTRLFTFNEHSIYKVLCDWLFLQLNPDIQLMPCQSTILSYFNSFSKSCSLLEREEGRVYEPLFAALRLHGITDTNHLRDMQMMNVVPQSWVINILSLHYQALQGGGDMTAFKNFPSASIRHGFIVDENPQYYSEILSLYGFHFELKAVKQDKKGSYNFFMQRLKPNDSVLTYRDCERHTFSMRPDRLVNFTVRVQCEKEGKYFTYVSPMISQKFGLSESISQSESVTIDNLETPFHTTFAVLFPSS
ncbi:BTB/POZ domain-containing protein 16-like [Liolophura sinensis]|uniref:BTB/POZ domain-containing protein 16-like n=1 Tax=Liolophura sinensis TaxID=3198878 RepID=UPI00315818B2